MSILRSRLTMGPPQWRRGAEILLLLGAVVTLGRAWSLWASSARTRHLVVRASFGSAATVALFDADSLAEAIDVVRDRDLFRFPTPTGGATPVSANPTVMPRPVRTPLLLRGITGGPPWQVVLEGVPGRSGHLVLRSGDDIGGLKIRAVVHDTVIIRGPDTTWRLTMKPQ